MSIGGFIRRSVFWLNDEKHGGKIKNAYDEIIKVNTSDNDSIQLYLLEKVSALLEHAQKTTKYYSNYYSRDLSSFPVVNKQIIIDNREDMRSSLYVGGQPLHEMHTSGSTGIPFVVQQDMNKRRRVIAEIKG